MTAALAELVRPIPGFGLRGVSARLLTVLAVALPVPVLAAAGRSLPLPSTVERLAAELVPFSNSSAVALGSVTQPLAHGSIVLAPEARAGATPERAVQLPRPSAVVAHRRPGHHTARAPELIATHSAPAHSAPATDADVPAASLPQPGGEASSPVSSSADEPTRSHAPAPEATAISPANSAVAAAKKTVTTATDTTNADVTGAADSAGAGSVTSTVTNATTAVADAVTSVTDPVTTTVTTVVDSSAGAFRNRGDDDGGEKEGQQGNGITSPPGLTGDAGNGKNPNK